MRRGLREDPGQQAHYGLHKSCLDCANECREMLQRLASDHRRLWELAGRTRRTGAASPTEGE